MKPPSGFDLNPLETFLVRKNIPRIVSDFEAIEFEIGDAASVKEKIESGEIYNGPGVVVLKQGGKELFGYMFMMNYDIDKWGKNPVMHIQICEIIERLSQNRYIWSNKEKVTVQNRNTSALIPNQVLITCRTCLKMVQDAGLKVQSTTQFVEKYGVPLSGAKDIRDYPIEWSGIRDSFMQKKNYTCESCGFPSKPMLAGLYLDVHHINYDKMNCDDDNLRLLCLKCHSEIDEHHRKTVPTNPRWEPFMEHYTNWQAKK